MNPTAELWTGIVAITSAPRVAMPGVNFRGALIPPSKATDASAWTEKSRTTTLFAGLAKATAAAV
jgi:hypothetical protein